jgi:hypothetical protein
MIMIILQQIRNPIQVKAQLNHLRALFIRKINKEKEKE